MTYLKTAALGLDDLGSALLLNRNDLSISAACALVRRGQDGPLRLQGWKRLFFRAVGTALEYFWPGHCEAAVDGDIARAMSTLQLLTRQP